MKIYDISQEVFTCAVFPGDPAPEKNTLSTMSDGALYNLTAFSMCSHNGTHVDAPAHFIEGGQTVDEMPLSKTVGWAFVAEHEGNVTAMDAQKILHRARGKDHDSARRILIKGKTTVTLPAAEVFAEASIYLLGNESQTVGPEDAPMATHLALLGAGVVLLEGIRLEGVPEGEYLLSAAPLSLGGCEGAPCRAILVDLG